MHLAYIINEPNASGDPAYTMFLARLNLDTLEWSPSTRLQAGQTDTKPKTAWTYPILVSRDEGLHMIATNCPDGSEGNTYNKVWYLFFPGDALEPGTRELVAECPMGHNAYGLDMAVLPSGEVHVLHMWNSRVYGDSLPEDSPPPGTYHARRDPANGVWSRSRLAPICVAGLHNAGGRLLAITQEGGTLIPWEWQAGNAGWSKLRPLCSREQIPAGPSFMDVIAPSSGSDMSAGLALVSDGLLPEAEGRPRERVVWSILPTGPSGEDSGE